MSKLFGSLLCSSILLVVASSAEGAATVWNGPTLSFTKLNGADPTLAINQDRLTSNVWLTRGSSQGLFNMRNEGSFTHFLSPSDTQWADGNLANYSSLNFTDWNHWAKGVHGGPSTTVGVDAVVHLISDDIYLSLKFTSWTSGGAGGGFSYIRSTPTIAPEPGSGLLLLAGLGLFGWRIRNGSDKRD